MVNYFSVNFFKCTTFLIKIVTADKMNLLRFQFRHRRMHGGAQNNFFSILTDAAPLVLLALSELMVMLVAGIDLSVGAVAGLTGALAATMMLLGFPWPLALFLALLAATSAGLLQGEIDAYRRRKLP